MKRAFISLVVCAFVMASCQPDPIITLDKEYIDFTAEGGTATVRVIANNEWNVILENDNFSVTPTSGVEEGYVTVTAKPNTSSSNIAGRVVFVCNSHDKSASAFLAISQTCAAGKLKLVDWDKSEVPAEGGTKQLTFESNAPWTLTCDASDISLDKEAGTAGTNTVIITVPANPEFEARTVGLSLHCTTAAGFMTLPIPIKQLGGVLTYGGETYKAVQMKDGKWWMAENLRYIPSGMTPTNDASAVNNGIWYPLVIDELTADKASVKFSSDAADIKANGYLYSTEVALGLKPGDITVDNAASFEGKQGICPSGWHIPTKADIIGLVGKTADKNDTNANAPYYDANLNGGNGSVALLNGDGFNAGAWGAVSIANTAATKGTTMGAIKAYQNGMNTGYIAGSTMRQVTTNDDGTLKNVQFVAFMPNMNNGTFNGAWNNYRNGVSVRCVKND